MYTASAILGAMIGQHLKDTYRIVSEIGAGGMGTVYVAEHKTLPRRFAVKFLKAASASSAETLARFEREAMIASGLGHPNIVEVVDFDRTPEGDPFIVMELLDGEDLAARIAGGGAMAPKTLLPLARQICSALAAAEAAGIVHRDLKPQNIFLHTWGGEEHLKVLDFGISKISDSATGLTADATIMGTPHYMAPEQIQTGAAGVDARADLFALGAILYECLTGDQAFPGESFPKVIYAICHAERPRLRAVRPDLPQALEAALGRLMEADPGLRYPGVQAAWKDLAPALGGMADTLTSSGSRRVIEAAMAETVATPMPSELDATVPQATTEGAAEPTPAEVTPGASAGAPQTGAEAAAPAPPPPGRKKLVYLVILGVLGLAWGLAWALFGKLTSDDIALVVSSSAPASAPAPAAATAPHAVRPTVTVRLALLKVECKGIGESLVEALRESRLRTRAGLVVPADDVALAVKRLGAKAAGLERRVGRALSASLVLGGRCAGGRLIVRLVRVVDGAIVATRRFDKTPSDGEIKDLAATIATERIKLVVARETRNPKASQAYLKAFAMQQGGINPSTTPQVITLLRQVVNLDATWMRPRLQLADLLTLLYMWRSDRKLLTEATRLVAGLERREGPYLHKVLTLQGFVALWNSDLHTAEQKLRAAQVANPRATRAAMYLAVVHNICGKDRQAEQVLRRAIAHNRGVGDLHLQLAQLLLARGLVTEGLAAIAPALKIQDRQRRLGDRDPQVRLGALPVAGAHTVHGLLLLSSNRLPEARKELELELAQSRTLVHFWRNSVAVQTLVALGHVHRRLGERAQADKAFARGRKSLETMVKGLADACFPLTSSVEPLIVFEPQLVLDVLRRWAKPNPMFDDHYRTLRAAAIHRLGRPAEAKKLYDEALAKSQPFMRQSIRVAYGRFLSQFSAVDAYRRKSPKR